MVVKQEQGQFSFQSQRKARPKNIQTTIQLCSFRMLARLCSKSFKLGFTSTWTETIQMYKLGLEKAQEPEIKLQHLLDHRESKRLPEKCLLWLFDYTKPLTVWVITNCGKFLKRWEYPTTLPASSETCMRVKKHQLEPAMEQQTYSNLGKECVKTVYCHPAYLTYMQNTSCEMLG